jgi:hypothetical protein
VYHRPRRGPAGGGPPPRDTMRPRGRPAAILAGASIFIGPALVVSALATTDPPDGGATAADGADPLRGVVAHLAGDREEVRRFGYVESAVLEKRGPEGSLRSRSIEVYEIFLRDGQPMRRPLSIDPGQDGEGSAAVRREESRILAPARTAGSGAAKPVKDSAFDAERLVRCFRFSMQGEEALGGRRTRRVGFVPVDGCLDDGSRAGRLLQNLFGTLWIDEADQDVLRIEGHIERPVNFGFGLLGRVDDFSLRVDREPVAPGLYTMTHMDYRARGTALVFHRFDITSTRDRSAFARAPDGRPEGLQPDQARHEPHSPPGRQRPDR